VIGRRRERVTEAFTRFHRAVAQVLGSGERLRDEAARRQALAAVALWVRREGLDAVQADPALAAVLRLLRREVAEAEQERAQAYDGWLGHGPAQLTELVARAATGAAGEAGTAWLGDVPWPRTVPGDDLRRTDEAAEGLKGWPELWRIGTGRLDIGAEFPVAVPLLDEAHLRVDSQPESRAAAESVVELLLLRLLSVFRPGVVHVHVWDGSQYGLFPALHPLSRTGLLTSHDPDRLDDLLDELSERIRRVQSRVLVDGSASLREHTERTGKRSESWLVVVLAGNRAALPDEQQRRVQRIARSGLACGIQLVMLDQPVTVGATCESVRFDKGVVRCSMTGPFVSVLPDAAPPRAEITGAATRIAESHERWKGLVRGFADLLPRERWMTESSESQLIAPIGWDDGAEVELKLDDGSPHALVGGPSGSGKTNLLLAMIGSLAARYGPDELQFYLLDFKEGVSFAQFAPGRKDETWLPHARLIGINVNTDREFGLALLQFLADEMRRRAEEAKAHEVTKLEELRQVPGVAPIPRIVAVIDEFQYLFAENDALAKRATNLLEDVARRGRSQGIHLVFASQDVSGIEAFWGRPAIFEQFVLRIALPRARRVLANLNEAALTLPRRHAVVNHESGMKHANEIARIPDAGAGSAVHEVQRVAYSAALAKAGPGGPVPPRVFDGARAPLVTDLLADLVPGRPAAVVGQVIDMRGSAATVDLPDTPGRNVAVLGSSTADAVAVLGGIAAGLGVSAPLGSRFVVAPLAAELPVAALSAHPESAVETVRLDGYRALVESLAAEVTARAAGGGRTPVYLLVAGADAADPLLERPGTEALRTVVRFGPEVGVHVLGWWRSASRLKQLLSLSASVDDVGAWIALDVQGSELNPFAPTASTSWSPRSGRGLFFDRARHARPDVVIVPRGAG
jgi:hypothetical protein